MEMLRRMSRSATMALLTFALGCTGASDGTEASGAKLGEQTSASIGTPPNLTGIYRSEWGSYYYIRSVVGTSNVWWVGLDNLPSGGDAFWQGLNFTNVFHGTYTPDDIVLSRLPPSAAAATVTVHIGTISGSWADVPRALGAFGSGTLTLDVYKDLNNHYSLSRSSATGGFGESQWAPGSVGTTSRLLLGTRESNTMRNDGNDMNDHMDEYKDFAVVYGSVWEPPRVGFPPNNQPGVAVPVAPTYNNFINAPWWCTSWIFGDDPPDGDIDFRIQMYPRVSDPPIDPSFWTTGFLMPASQITDKLAQGGNLIRTETIMYGRNGSTTYCPGWAENNANGVLINGKPMSVSIFSELNVPGSNCNILSSVCDISGDLTCPVTFPSPWGTPAKDSFMRFTGVLGLDCHGISCDNDDPSKNNVEIHPVYSMDVIANVRSDTLEGVWGATNSGTFYIRQLGQQVWWLGMSADFGQSWTQVFQGTLSSSTLADGTTLQGTWVDVPQGGTNNSGTISLTVRLHGRFIGPDLLLSGVPYLTKLYDRW
jgi:hypothetical protein